MILLSDAQTTRSMEGIRKDKALVAAFLLDTFLWPIKEKYPEKHDKNRTKNKTNLAHLIHEASFHSGIHALTC